jgi:ABC-type phosphonate transport system ATPase subunit
LTAGAAIQASRIDLAGVDLTRQSERSWRAIRGRQIGFILQDALVSLDQLRRVGDEVAEPLKVHGWGTKAARAGKAVGLLALVGVPEPEMRARQRPYELSGGLRQRALIASAIALDPRLVVRPAASDGSAIAHRTRVPVDCARPVLEAVRISKVFRGPDKVDRSVVHDVSSSCPQARPSASSASRDRARPRARGSHWPCCRRPPARSCSTGSHGRRSRQRSAGRCASGSASSIRTRDRILVMQDGRVVESGTADEVFERPQDPYTQRLLTALPPAGSGMSDATGPTDPTGADRLSRADSRTVRGSGGS